MNFRRFLGDRLGYAALFAINLIIIILIVSLDLSQQKASLQFGNILYIALLSIALLAIFMFTEYVRQRRFYKELTQAARTDEDSMEQALLLNSAATREQEQFIRITQNMYRTYADRLSALQSAHERQIHFMQQWAHHMKTPISVIDLITQHSADEGCKAAMESIREESDRLHEGVNTLLYTARLGQFELDVHIRRISLLALVRKSVNEQKSAWIRSGVFPRIAAEDEDAEIESDEKWLSFIINQLLVNAMKYTSAAKMSRETQPEVVLSIQRRGDRIELTTADNGIGIPEEDLPRVFDPFFTGRNGRLVRESTGMGLYLAKEVCERLGHGISIRSALGKGTSVTLTFAVPNVTFREPLGR